MENALVFIMFISIVFLLFSTSSFAENEKILMPKRSAHDQLGYYPEDRELVRVNPPYFLWMPEDRAVTYELELSDTADFFTKEIFSDIVHSVLLLHKPLEPEKTYFWRFRYKDKDNNYSPYSNVRQFTISKSAPEFYIPPHNEIKKRIGDHPRLFVTKDNIETMQNKRFDIIGEILWQDIYWEGKAVTAKNPGKEPADFPGGVWEVNHWTQMLSQTTQTVDPLEKAAFVYVITGEKDVGLRAKEWLLEVAKWDPNGPTSAKVNDECSMNIIYRLCRSYTWLYDLLTEDEKLIVQDSVRQRGEEIYKLLTKPGAEYHISPYTSHSGRQIAFLGEAAIAFLNEIEEADKWFDYVTDVFFSIYPAWGKEDGGWAEGPIYWRWYMERILWFSDAYLKATGINLLDKPFFQNTGYFGLYVHPPYSKHSPFGDNLDSPANIESYYVMNYLGEYTQNPYLKWHAKQIKGIMPKGIMGFLWYGDSVEPLEPNSLPQSRYFRDIGWVAMHTDLTNEKDNIHLLFKSSPYGSYSHSHADQNAFTLEAFGSPLIISSGYYPYYGSPHHSQWTRATISKSTILVNGTGQPVQSFAAKGQITDFVSSKNLDYTLGDAAAAYSGRLKKFDREIFFVKPYFVLIRDTIDAQRESSFDWLLHSREEFMISGNKFTILDGKAKLHGEIHGSLPLKLTAHNEFTVEPEDISKPKQWHFTANTTEKADNATFTALLVPQRATQTDTYNATWENDAAKISYRGTTTIALFTDAAFGLTTDGKSALAYYSGENLTSILISKGTFLNEGSSPLLVLSREGSASITIDGNSVYVDKDPLEESMEITMQLLSAPKMVFRDGNQITSWDYRPDTKTLSIYLP